jgi:oxepin-CoA hydrolase/3-oxo-5,6-dehydrosuberyl-CoA semialdehyde dehydrogenase
MSVQQVQSFACGAWVSPSGHARPIESAITGAVIAEAGGQLDTGAMLDYARRGGAALRQLSFHDRARMLKALAAYLNDRRTPLYDLSFDTGATAKDHLIDIDGGIGATFVFASKGRREMPDSRVYLDGGVEQLSRAGTFLGRHICVPKQGVAVHINAFNFPVWGMLEKLAPTLLAGMPAIVKPATASCYVTELAVRMMLESGLLPAGALQLICGPTGDLLDQLGGQDVVSFTGSADTAMQLRATPALLAGSVPFIAEQDSLNAAVLGPDAAPGTPEFDLFIKEATREITAKAGQKCTAVRRLIVPDPQPVIEALSLKLKETRVGDPRDADTQMGALISAAQRRDVAAKAAKLAREARLAYQGEAPETGGFCAPRLYHCADPDAATEVHRTEAFGPVSTVMGYRDLAHAASLANRGEGSLVGSIFSHDMQAVQELTLTMASHHGRIYVNNRTSAREATGHGAPLPHMVHGGPGRAGGGEEQGGIRGVMHYMQRTAVQGSPDVLTAIGGAWVPGSAEQTSGQHPFRRAFGDLAIGETIHTKPRVVTLEDIEHFAHFTGDTFYGHMDEEAAAANPFFPGRVAHGYLLLSFAAGLFVDPDPGPVLANTGLDSLRFMKPVRPNDSIQVRLSVKAKTKRNDEYGEVRWHVTLTNQDGEVCAEYELLTMNAF